MMATTLQRRCGICHTAVIAVWAHSEIVIDGDGLPEQPLIGDWRLTAPDLLAQQLEPEPIFFRRGEIGLGF